MASDESSNDRSEQPTAKRREEARREGRIAVSRELPGALVLLGSLGVYGMAGGHAFSEAVRHFERGLSSLPAADLTQNGVLARFLDAAIAGVAIAWPFLVVPAVIAVAVGVLQSGGALSMTPVTPKWNRIDPWQGFGRILSARGAVDVLRAVLKLAVVGTIAYLTLRGEWESLTIVGEDGLGMAALGRVVWALWLRIGLAFLLIAGLDYGYQWWQHEKGLRMSKDEVRRESKELEGSPQMRAHMRALQRQVAKRRMMADVRQADVVLRNPTHFAVALRYDAAKMRAPKVVAKGERLVAQRIIEEAARHDVPVVENPPLARALFRAVKIGREVPNDLYRAVAEVLAYVYALRGRPR